MMTRTSRKSIIFHCDTRPCRAELHTGRTTLGGASDYARKQGWAIGNDLDACPEHHA